MIENQENLGINQENNDNVQLPGMEDQINNGEEPHKVNVPRRKEKEEKKKEEKKKEEKKKEEKKKEEKKGKEVEIEFMKPNAHFMYQTMLEYNEIYTIFYFLLEIVLFVYKSFKLQYAPHSISVEIVCLIFFLIIQLVRFYLGSLGNRSETSKFILFSLIFVIAPLYTYVQFLILQTYVLKIEIIINSIGLILTAIEIVFCLLAFLAISKQEKTM